MLNFKPEIIIYKGIIPILPALKFFKGRNASDKLCHLRWYWHWTRTLRRCSLLLYLYKNEHILVLYMLRQDVLSKYSYPRPFSSSPVREVKKNKLGDICMLIKFKQGVVMYRSVKLFSPNPYSLSNTMWEILCFRFSGIFL